MDGELSTASAAPQQSAAPESAPAQASAPQASQSYSTNNNSSATSENASQANSAPSSRNQQILAQSKTNGGAGRQQLVVDAFGRRVVKFNNDIQAAEQAPSASNNFQAQGAAGEPNVQQRANEQILSGDIDAYVQQQNFQPQEYNLDEFSMAIATGNIDERRVPEQFRGQYQQFKINQAVQQYNAQQQAIAQQQAAQTAAINQQLTPEQRAQNMTDFYQSLEKESSMRAQQDANLSQDDLENLPYMDENDPKRVNYNMAKEFHRQQIMVELQQMASQEQAQRIQREQTYNGINAFINDARQKEPNFNEIDKIMLTRFETLPFKEGQRIAGVIEAMKNGTITEPQTLILKEYYDNCRREFYAKRNGLSTQPQQTVINRPAVVERAGGNNAPAAQYKPDYEALRNMGNNPRAKREWIAQFMRARNR